MIFVLFIPKYLINYSKKNIFGAIWLLCYEYFIYLVFFPFWSFPFFVCVGFSGFLIYVLTIGLKVWWTPLNNLWQPGGLHERHPMRCLKRMNCEIIFLYLNCHSLLYGNFWERAWWLSFNILFAVFNLLKIYIKLT